MGLEIGDYSRLKGNQGRRRAILVRTVDPAHCKRGEVELLVELNRTQGDEGILSSWPLIVYRSGKEWRVWTTGQTTQCLKSGLEKVAEKWKEEGPRYNLKSALIQDG